MPGISLTPVNRSDIPAVSTRQSSESARLFREFMESDSEVVAVTLEDADKLASARSTLGNYVKRHELPVRLFTRNGNLYLEKVTDGGPTGDVEAEQSAEQVAAEIG